MNVVRVSDKGQITIPADVRRKMGIEPASKMQVDVRGDEIVLKRQRSIKELYGIFAEAAKGKGTDWKRIKEQAMKEVAEEVAREGMD